MLASTRKCSAPPPWSHSIQSWVFTYLGSTNHVWYQASLPRREIIMDHTTCSGRVRSASGLEPETGANLPWLAWYSQSWIVPPCIEYKATSALGALDLEPPSAPLECSFTTGQGGSAHPRSITRKCRPGGKSILSYLLFLSFSCSPSLSSSRLCRLRPPDPQRHTTNT